jgi:ribosomal protein S18 acetylase RimI-like enzyme
MTVSARVGCNAVAPARPLPPGARSRQDRRMAAAASPRARARAGIRLRPARRADARAIAAVCSISWRERYRGIVPGRILGGVTLRRLLPWARGLVTAPRSWGRIAIVGGRPVGVAVFRRRARGRIEVFQLFVLPEFQGIGAGRALIEDGLHEAARRGARVELWVLRENQPARRWYAARGGRPGRPGALRWSGVKIPMRLYEWPPAGARGARG